MIIYKYKLYRTTKTKHLELMLGEACFVWNHALALQKRYYRIYKGYINLYTMQKHFAKRIRRKRLHSQTTQAILKRLDDAYKSFFRRKAKRPPKYKSSKDFPSFVLKQGGYSLNENVLTINSIKKRYKFSLSRQYKGKIKNITIKRNNIGEFFLIIVSDHSNTKFRKSHNGASVGIDFGLKTYMTLSDGTCIANPLYLKKDLEELRKKSSSVSTSKKSSHNRVRKRLELCRLYKKIKNRRDNFQWELAHNLCRHFDYIFIEDLEMLGMCKMWGRKMSDLAHSDFVMKLQYLATRYGVTVHKINRFYPSSKTCTCGFVNNQLKIHERVWTCPKCGTVHKRDLLAANNILRQGIAELDSVRKSKIANGEYLQTHLIPTISREILCESMSN